MQPPADSCPRYALREGVGDASPISARRITIGPAALGHRVNVAGADAHSIHGARARLPPVDCVGATTDVRTPATYRPPAVC